MIIEKEGDIENLIISGNILREVLDTLKEKVKEGCVVKDLDIEADKIIRDRGGVPSFLNYKPQGAKTPFPSRICFSVNDELVHGLPKENREIKNGDLITIDCGVNYNGYYTDSAVSFIVGGFKNKEIDLLLENTKLALKNAIEKAVAGNKIRDISREVEKVANEYGYGVPYSLGGHGVGRSVHEEPFIPNVETEEGDEVLKEGMVIAIEPIFTLGSSEIKLAEDNWAYKTDDGSIGAHFEHTIMITKEAPIILTGNIW